MIAGRYVPRVQVSFAHMGSLTLPAQAIRVLSPYYRRLQDPYGNPQDYDVGLLHLPVPIPAPAEPWKVVVPDDLKGRPMEVRAYWGGAGPNHLQGVIGRRRFWRLLAHTAPAERGFSGGPVSTAEGVVAIHAARQAEFVGSAYKTVYLCVAIDTVIKRFIDLDGEL
jgi:hypothetical protein